MNRPPPPEVQDLLKRVQGRLDEPLFQQLEQEFYNWVHLCQEFRADRNQALEARSALLTELERIKAESARYREERNYARRERDLFRALMMSDELPSARPYLSGVLDGLIALTGAQKGVCMLFSKPGEVRSEAAELIERNCDNEDLAVVREQLQLSQGIVRQALASRSIVYTEEAIKDSRFAEHASVRLFRLKTVLCAPLLDAEGEGLGVLYLEHRGRSNAFPETDRKIIELITAHVSRWVSRQQIVRRASEAVDHTLPHRERYGFKEIVGRSEGLAETLRLITLSLDLSSLAPVLITGEPGTGKELVARALHFNSQRARGPFVVMNCSTVPAELHDITLFGHSRGAFAGADRQQVGKLELAHGGTLFLDDVSELSQSAQARLLKALQEREVVRLGEQLSRAVDVRVIAASHRDIRTLIRAGGFREDLFFRLDIFPIAIPPLRDRREDLAPLSEFLLIEPAQRAGQPLSLSPDGLALLQQLELPGNVRELQARLARAAMHATDGVITAALLHSAEHPGSPARKGGRPLPTWKEATTAFQRQLLVDALQRTERNLQAAAEMLGISRQHLSRLLHELDLNEHRPAQRGRKPRRDHAH